MTQPWMNTYWTGERAALYKADAQKIPLPDKSVHCVMTSPPYWGLRDYGLGRWEGGDAECDHVIVERPAFDGYSKASTPMWRNRNSEPVKHCLCGAVQETQGIGLEPTLGEWVESVVAVGREVWRALRDDGTFWLNIGDAYTSGNRATFRGESKNKGQQVQDNMPRPATPEGLKAKDLMGQPWRVAFALQDDGWLLRSAIIWHKKNPMPESVTDRPTSSYEMVFLLTKSGSPTFWTHQDGYGSRTKPPPDYRMVNGKRLNLWRGHDYFYDAEAIREGQSEATMLRSKYAWTRHPRRNNPPSAGPDSHSNDLGTGANARNVWSISTQGRPDAHFATFPDELPRRCILAGTSERGVCAECGAPWVRRTSSVVHTKGTGRNHISGGTQPAARGWEGVPRGTKETKTTGWQPTCGHNSPPFPAIVLDPFVGSGTTVAVAQSLGRCGIGLDLNTEYLDIAIKRITCGKFDWTPEDGKP